MEHVRGAKGRGLNEKSRAIFPELDLWRSRLRLRVAFDEKRRRSARSPPKNSRPQLELPRNARYGVATLLFLCYLEFFRLASIMPFWDSWMAGATWVGGYLQRFLCMSLSPPSKFLEFHSSVFFLPSQSQRSSEPNKHFSGMCARIGF